MVEQAYVSVIHNAEEGSVQWFHEQRHGWQQEKFKAIVLYTRLSNFALISCFMLALLTKNYGYHYFDLIYWILVLWISLDAIIELDAHVYSIEKTSLRRWLHEVVNL